MYAIAQVVAQAVAQAAVVQADANFKFFFVVLETKILFSLFTLYYTYTKLLLHFKTLVTHCFATPYDINSCLEIGTQSMAWQNLQSLSHSFENSYLLGSHSLTFIDDTALDGRTERQTCVKSKKSIQIKDARNRFLLIRHCTPIEFSNNSRGYVRNLNQQVHYFFQDVHFVLKFIGSIAQVLEIHGFTSRCFGNQRVHRNQTKGTRPNAAPDNSQQNLFICLTFTPF